MAWGRAKPVEPEPSALARLAPLIILFVVIAIGVFIAYHLSNFANDVSKETTRRLEKKNVTMTRDGVKVQMTHVRDERIVDSSQNFVVKAWNLSKWPAYKSRLWNKQEPATDVQKTK